NLGFGNNVKVDVVIEEAIRAMREAGAELVDVDFPTDVGAGWKHELEVMLFELKADLGAYLATRHDVALTREGFTPTLAGVIAFNEAHRDEELRHFGQDHF